MKAVDRRSICTLSGERESGTRGDCAIFDSLAWDTPLWQFWPLSS